MSRPKLIIEADKYRGLIIGFSIQLERLIDFAIARYFSPNDDSKQVELLNLILSTDRVNFDAKRQIFEYLCKEKYPDFIINNPDFFNDLERRIIPKRNIFAHYVLASSGKDALDVADQKIGLIKFKNDNKIIWFTWDELKEHIDLILNNIDIMSDFLKSL